MHIRVKICGVTTEEGAAAAAESGADAVGLVFANSPRRVGLERAAELSSALPPFVTRVAVFRHPGPSEVARVLRAVHPDLLQAEPDPRLMAVLGGTRLLPVVHDSPDLLERAERQSALNGTNPALLLEGPGRGGKGVRPDWERAARLARRARLTLAGGLTPDNVARAIRTVRPHGVDVSSGVEARPGRKDPSMIADFIAAVREAQAAVEDS